MLRGPRSLALRASIIFTAVVGAIMLSIVGINAALSWADRGVGNLRGPVIAVDYAAEDLRFAGDRLRLATDGRFAGLAARNPTLWLIAVKDGRAFRFGPVPEPALGAVAELQGPIDTVILRLRGEQLPMGAAALKRIEFKQGDVLLAAGGVHPATLSTGESLHFLFEPEILVALLTVALISLLAMLIAVPSFVRALAPITREAAAIDPSDLGRRLQEANAPTELLPLVRGFNAALDRLEIELGRRKRFIADAAHELRTPLAVVSLQADGLPDGDSKRDLQRGLQRLTQLVSQMLDLERLSSSGQPRSALDLVTVARDAVADLAPMAISKGYELSLAAPRTPVIVRGNVHAVRRALTNLIGNAISYGGGGGAIVVTVDKERTIDVADDGPGVAPELEQRLFEPFSRGHSACDGCGLGLHLTREIMTSHGGDVRLVDSTRGAKFRLTFPPSQHGG